ncbi:MAG: hypothetical protein ACI8TP_002168 [Acidimicrobiales bacterium]
MRYIGGCLCDHIIEKRPSRMRSSLNKTLATLLAFGLIAAACTGSGSDAEGTADSSGNAEVN